MKKTIFIIVVVVSFILMVLGIWASVGGEDNIAKEILSTLGTLALVGVAVVGAVLKGLLESSGITPPAPIERDVDTGMMSCQKCGYLGARTGICPRCGWNRTHKIKTSSSLISCMQCGYLGVGTSICPRCGWNRTKKITLGGRE